MGQKVVEDPLETEGRNDADFAKVEAMLFERLTKAGVSSFSTTAALKLPGAAIEGLLGWLGNKNPLVRNARADQNEVWILDNTGYKTSDAGTWKAEVVTAFFQHGRGDLVQAAAAIADAIGLDGKAGADEDKKKIIAKRLKPFIDAIAAARTLPVQIQPQGGKAMNRTLGPSDTNGIASQILEVGAYDQQNGAANTIQPDPNISNLPKAQGMSRLAAAQGFGIIR